MAALQTGRDDLSVEILTKALEGQQALSAKQLVPKLGNKYTRREINSYMYTHGTNDFDKLMGDGPPKWYLKTIRQDLGVILTCSLHRLGVAKQELEDKEAMVVDQIPSPLGCNTETENVRSYMADTVRLYCCQEKPENIDIPGVVSLMRLKYPTVFETREEPNNGATAGNEPGNEKKPNGDGKWLLSSELAKQIPVIIQAKRKIHDSGKSILDHCAAVAVNTPEQLALTDSLRAAFEQYKVSPCATQSRTAVWDVLDELYSCVGSVEDLTEGMDDAYDELRETAGRCVGYMQTFDIGCLKNTLKFGGRQKANAHAGSVYSAPYKKLVNVGRNIRIVFEEERRIGNVSWAVECVIGKSHGLYTKEVCDDLQAKMNLFTRDRVTTLKADDYLKDIRADFPSVFDRG
jgi:hypothetical protein